ncbi:hypothetical protein T492DRAFT_626656 [Pavlovales sp. CCMP2436]|nr:hypothetical protein T492DRAFT_626656 [Pavlovales sp. CCMP2436]
MASKFLQIALALSGARALHGFSPTLASARALSRARALLPVIAFSSARAAPSMGIFDVISKAFSNQEFNDSSAKASHILFKGGNSKGEARMVKARIDSGELTFANAARQFSECPSKSKGGSLGSFNPGQMVKEFDAVVFNAVTKIGEINTVETQFGTHLVKVDQRSN